MLYVITATFVGDKKPRYMTPLRCWFGLQQARFFTSEKEAKKVLKGIVSLPFNKTPTIVKVSTQDLFKAVLELRKEMHRQTVKNVNVCHDTINNLNKINGDLHATIMRLRFS